MNANTTNDTSVSTEPAPKMSYDEYVRIKRRQYIAMLRHRAYLKHHLIICGSLQGIAAKARLIIAGKGKNGKSMSAPLLERHLALR